MLDCEITHNFHHVNARRATPNQRDKANLRQQTNFAETHQKQTLVETDISRSQILCFSPLRDIVFADVTDKPSGGMYMAVSYKKLFHLLIERDMTTAQLQQQAGFSANITTRMKRNRYLSLDTIESICRVMSCGVDDILEFVPEAEETNNG